MTDVTERLVVQCPDHEASHYITAFIADHLAGDGTVCIALRLRTSRLADRRPLIERRVTATLSPLKSSGDPYPTYSITSSPKGDGPSPEFAGALAVEKTARDGYFGLIVSGRYEPFGTFGAILDASNGRRIACVWARGLLRSIAGGLCRVPRAPITNCARGPQPAEVSYSGWGSIPRPSSAAFTPGPDLQLVVASLVNARYWLHRRGRRGGTRCSKYTRDRDPLNFVR
jgi:hypothetical protein